MNKNFNFLDIRRAVDIMNLMKRASTFFKNIRSLTNDEYSLDVISKKEK